jgi:hypothetical protein
MKLRFVSSECYYRVNLIIRDARFTKIVFGVTRKRAKILRRVTFTCNRAVPTVISCVLAASIPSGDSARGVKHLTFGSLCLGNYFREETSEAGIDNIYEVQMLPELSHE